MRIWGRKEPNLSELLILNPSTTQAPKLFAQFYMALLVQVFVLTFVCLLAFLVLKPTKRNSRGLPLPPGPSPHFLFGNLWDFPTIQPWITYTHWKKQYGASPSSFNFIPSDRVQ